MIKKILGLFVLWRLLLFIPIIIAYYFLPLRPDRQYTLFHAYLKSDNPINHFLVTPWANFDGISYLLIAAKAYTVDAGFFPFFPLLIRLVTAPFGYVLPFMPIQYISALILVCLLTIVSVIVFYRLVRLDYSSSISWWSIIFLLSFPTSFYLISVYTESTFLLLGLSSLYFARQKKWLLASICAGLLTATRFVGIAIIPALCIEFLRSEKILGQWKASAKKDVVTLIKKGWPLILTPIGLLCYMAYNYYWWHDPLTFLKAQGTFRNNRSVSSIVLFPQTIYRYIKILLSLPVTQYEWWGALLEVTLFVGALALLFIAWKKGVRFSYLVFATISILIPASTGTLSGVPRYVLMLFPMYIVLAHIQSARTKIILVTIGIVSIFIFLGLFSRGYFIA